MIFLFLTVFCSINFTISTISFGNPFFCPMIFTFIPCLIISFFCQSGDLFISYFKRLNKIKDTGNILPGHGGLLDRIDGIVFAVPVAFILDKIFF